MTNLKNELRPVGAAPVDAIVRHLSDDVTVVLGDCLTVDLPQADAVISDPPYGMNWNTNSTRFSGGKSLNIKQKPRGDGRSDYGVIENDAKPFDPLKWIDYPRCVLFGANHFYATLPVGTTLVWIKKDKHLWGTFLSDAEIAWSKGGHGVYVNLQSFPPPVRAVDSGGDPGRPVGIHPTQKPVGIMAWCMERAKVPDGGLVLDPYMGSGTTGIACIRTGRRFFGVEIDPRYFDAACERLTRELAQGRLF